MSNKVLIIVVNGKGGSGKDTAIEDAIKHSGLNIKNITSIQPIIDVAQQLGYTGSKSDKDRKFLSDLKALSQEYNDFPSKAIVNRTVTELRDERLQILFVHIREPENIDKYLAAIDRLGYPSVKTTTMLITNPETKNKTYGNKSDDEVDNYHYKYSIEYEYTSDSLKDFTRQVQAIYWGEVDG